MSPADGATDVLIRNIKQSLCYVAADYDEELNAAAAGRTYKTYDTGSGILTVGAERFRATEMMFRPSIAGTVYGTLCEATFN